MQTVSELPAGITAAQLLAAVHPSPPPPPPPPPPTYIVNNPNAPGGCFNSGEGNTGCGNAGSGNVGDGNGNNNNQGDDNVGASNRGNGNTGNANTGNQNSGNENVGNENTGFGNVGNNNGGNFNSGNQNPGNNNTGLMNSGNDNVGNNNTGNYNIGNRNSGSINNSDDTESGHNSRDQDAGHFASTTLQLSGFFFLAASVLLLCSAYYSNHPGKILWKEKPQAAGGVIPPKEWFQSIDQDLAPWNSTGISYSQVENAYCGSGAGAFRMQIIGGQIYIVGEQESFQTRGHSVKMMLLHLQNTFGDMLPDVDVGAIATGDLPGDSVSPHGCPEIGPVFSFSKRPEDVKAVRWPDFGFYDWPEAHSIPWEFFTIAIAKAARAMPWQTRTSQLFMRAAGIGPTREALRDSQDELSKNPLWNVKIIDWGGNSPSFVTVLDHCKFRYLLHTAGNTYSGRLKYLPFCGSAIVMPHSPWTEFWYGMLEHGKNVYRTDAVNHREDAWIALDAAKALEKDDAMAQTIARGAHELAVNMLTTRNIELFMLELLKRYSQLMDFKVALHPDAESIEESLMGQNFMRPEQRTCPICHM
ncbi:hypothetical protein WJX84_011906 [Apatococcus fuscideae]|uniref:Glycosyl transferase CAP10 domain-containing protein n=1 Tax=Apatococcus fuscideae TaxID=2026836 RepID=A0AAW1SXD0_9CHLO